MEQLALACFGDSDESLAKLSTLITSFANFTVQYNFSCISLALIMMSQKECTSDDGNCAIGEQADWVEGASEAGIFVGAVIGEIYFGYLGDYFGRSEAMILAMSIAFVSIFISAFFSLGTSETVYAVLILFRFVAGIGLGGMFPLAATKASEDASQHAGKVNSKASSWSFFWQLPALLMPYFLGIILTKSSLGHNARWRFILGFGLIPCFFTLLTLFIERPLRARKLLQRQEQATAHIAMGSFASHSSGHPSGLPAEDDIVVSDSSQHQKKRQSGAFLSSHSELTLKQIIHLLQTQPSLRWRLLAAGGSWFIYDVVVYGLGLLSTYTISAITDDDGNISSSKSVRVLCEEQLIALCAIIPATILSIQLVPLLGLKYLQMLGFAVQGLCCLMIAISFPFLHAENPKALFGLYCVVYASLNFGSGITTFALPAALFPKEIRTTFNGMAAAMGKTGAVVSTFSFYLIAESAGYPCLLAICASISLFGSVFTWFMIDSKQLMSEEKPAFGGDSDKHASGEENTGERSEYTHNAMFTTESTHQSSSHVVA
jgi:PHS family inorganic phosphate transporter-like MFS transporter